MCCGQKRSALRSAPAPARTWPTTPTVRQSTPNIPGHHHTAAKPSATQIAILFSEPSLLETSPVRVRGPVTGRQYNFSGSHPVQAVDSRDATALVRTRFFR